MNENSGLHESLSSTQLRRTVSLILILAFFSVIGVGQTFVQPFLPHELSARGVPSAFIGVIFSAYDIANLVSSIYLLFFFVNFKQRKLLFCLGGFITAVAVLLFGQLQTTFTGIFYIAACMIARLAWGCGYSIIWATAPPLLMSLFLKYPAFTVASTLSSAVLGVLIDRGSAGVIFCFPGFMLIALSMFSISRLGSVSNQSISLIIFEILIAMSGIGVYSVTNSSIPILRRLVSSHEDIPIVLIDTYATLTYTLCTGVGVSLGQILVGGLICGRFGFENGCLAIAIASAMSGAVTMVTLTKKGILFGTQNHLVYELDLDISEDGDSISA
ncbi:uncharacterized protein LOC134857313 [Symsagittifera roscoffensis]|uniref:uncharacterized protein LOC134857313 n=1 Tax=Symsagittifera roscoffensis TaxID=84072 RepID=UPI00307C69AB